MSSVDTVTLPRRSRWTRLSIVLHWVTVLLVLVQFVGHGWMEKAFETYQDGGTPASDVLQRAGLHALVGITILLATLARIWDRRTQGRPPYSPKTPDWAAWLSRANHVALYAVLIVMPLAGATAWFGGSEAAGSLHGALWIVLLGIVGLHAAGALAEHFLFRTDALRRMLGSKEGLSEVADGVE